MSVIEIIFRVDLICQKFDKYDFDKQRELNAYGDDAFARIYATIEKDIEAALSVKGLTNEDIAMRNELVLSLPQRIQAIPDGNVAGANQTGEWTISGFISKSNGDLDSEFFLQTEESSQFRQEYEMRKMKQDEGLDIISDGLDTSKNLAQDMNEELDRQVPLMNEIETKVDRATSDLRNTNLRLKKTVIELRSNQNFCIDIILLCVLLGIASYLYKFCLHFPSQPCDSKHITRQ